MTADGAGRKEGHKLGVRR